MKARPGKRRPFTRQTRNEGRHAGPRCRVRLIPERALGLGDASEFVCIASSAACLFLAPRLLSARGAFGSTSEYAIAVPKGWHGPRCWWIRGVRSSLPPPCNSDCPCHRPRSKRLLPPRNTPHSGDGPRPHGPRLLPG